ncbi:MAG: flagellar biosynthetic protein FliO [Desulfobaccales bacterium]
MHWLENWLIDVYSAVLPEGPAPFDSLAGPDFPFWQHFIKILTILSAMVGVMLLLLSLWKRLAPRYQRHPALIKVLATHYLAPKQSLILVAVGRETFLLASSANNLRVIPLARQETGVGLESLPALVKDAERGS